MTNTLAPAPTDYHAASEGAIWRALPGAGFLRLGGATRLDFLQRQTTNDLQLAGPDRALPNVLTAPTGRILEIFTLLVQGDSYALLVPHGRAGRLSSYLKKRIFFNDQVELRDETESWAQLELHGPRADAALAALGLETLPSLNQVLHFEFAGQPLSAIGIAGLGSQLGCLLLAPTGAAVDLQSALAHSGALDLSDESAEVLRLEAGRPGPAELYGEHTPFEVGLDAWVSGSKGCYTGQEVLARQVTYDKITRRLARLRCAAFAEPGASLLADGKTVGSLSSVALSPRLGPLGLAVLRRPHFAPGSQVIIRQDDKQISAEVF